MEVAVTHSHHWDKIFLNKKKCNQNNFQIKQGDNQHQVLLIKLFLKFFGLPALFFLQ